MATTSKRDFMAPEPTRTPPHAEELGGVMSTVKEKAQDLAENAGDLAGQAKEKVQEWTSAACETMGQATDKVKDWAATAYDQSGEMVQTVGSEATRLIRRYPLQALLVGFAVGFLLAKATRS